MKLRHVFVLAAALCAALPAAGADYAVNVIKPAPGELVLPQTMMVVMSYRSLTGMSIDPKRVKLFWDGAELNEAGMTITDRYLSFIPDAGFTSRPDLPGSHTLSLRIYDAVGGVLHNEDIRISIAQPVVFADDDAKTASAEAVRQRGNVIVTNTYDDNAYGTRNITDVRTTYSLQKGAVRFDSDVYFYSDEDPAYQPRHTARVDVSYGRGVTLGLGDRYPSYHPYVLQGQRIRGMELTLRTFNRNINTLSLHVAYGLSRMGSDNLGYTAGGSQQSGIYKRRILAVNPRFGGGDKFQLGLIMLKAKDDPGSVFIPLDDSTNALMYGDTPKDNLVLGANFIARMWQRRITLYGNWAFGLYTDDIRGGTLSKKQALTLGMNDVPSVIDKYSGWLIMNTTTSFLDPSGEALPQSVVYDAGTRLNIPMGPVDTYTDVKYFVVGPSFLSLGNEGVPSSRRGFNVSEQVGLLNRTLNLSGSFGTYVNNLDGLMPEATTFSNYSVGASYSPAPYLPSVNVSYSGNTSVNKADTVYTQDNASDNVQVSAGYRLATGDVTNQLSVFFGQGGFSSIYQDRSTNTNSGFGINSNFGDLPLRTNIRFSSSGNSALSAARYNQVDASGMYTLIPRTLDIEGTFATSMYENTDNNRMTYGLSLDYRLNRKLSIDLGGRMYTTADGMSGYSRGVLTYNMFD